MTDINNLTDIENAIKQNDFALFYFSTPECNVCKHLKPKVINMAEAFPNLNTFYVNLHEVQEASGKHSVFSIPAILVFINGQETLRESRHLSLEEMKRKISRYYDMFYGS